MIKKVENDDCILILNFFTLKGVLFLIVQPET